PERLVQVGPQQPVGPERGAVLRGQERGVGVETARLRQREQPLDEVVDRFQVVIAPPPEVVQMPALGVRRRAAVKVYQPGHAALLSCLNRWMLLPGKTPVPFFILQLRPTGCDAL